METVQIPSKLLTFLKGKHLLLDTNLFRDSAIKPTIFKEFFNKLKSSGVTLTTIDLVKYEILKGSSSPDKYKATEKLVGDIIDVTIPITSTTYPKV